ncbi:MAG: MBL fold metallo-hydrolase [Synergistaceae bacterium]|jgi:Cft2 family RNA processing exonuclease|nr:MBL fold metallo-hydrolase [Synergistaceae bacterium]
MKLSFGGGASEVGASFLMLQLDGKNIALDCGVRMSGDPMPDFQIINEYGSVDCVVLTHAHVDHSGALPVLSREYPEARIYMTHATKDLVRILLYDSLKIMEQKELEIPMYAEIHVKKMLDNALCFSPTHTFVPFSDSDIEITFYSAGHIAGAAGIFLSGKEGSFFYSGDFSITPQRTVEGASFPKLRPDVAVFESTYGDRLHANRDIEEARLVAKIESTTAEGGKLLIPAFSLGRSQEIILTINRAINKKQLPAGLKVYVDGMVNDICRVFWKHPNYLRTQYGKKLLKGNDIFYNDNVIPVNRDKALREKIVESKEGLVIISSSGMLTGGPSQWYAEKLAGVEKNAIALTGYQDEESPGRQLLELLAPGNAAEALPPEERALKIGEKSIPVKCDIGMYGLSAHADKMEILGLAQSLAAKRVFFNHGNEDVVNSLGAEFQKEFNGRVYIPKNGETFELFIRNKRKQAAARGSWICMPPPAGETEETNTLKRLWRFVLDQYGKAKGFTLEDLYYIAYGKPQTSSPAALENGNKNENENENEEEFIRFKASINKEPYFETEKKRPFIFHAVDEDDFPAQDGVMEVNAMLRLADTYFPPSTGLYKKGARFEEKKVLLYFNFPVVAVKALAEEIEAFEQETGWKAEVNAECNPGAAEQLINSLMGTQTGIKISYYRTEGVFQVTVDELPDNASAISESFRHATGLSLLVVKKVKKGAQPKPAQADTAAGQMEQNQTFNLIDRYFSDKPHKLYKKGLKLKDGIPGIELSFITLNAGRLYADDIDRLMEKTRWNIWINKESNQHELLKVARELFDKENIAVKKLSYLPEKACVQAAFDGAPLAGRDDVWEKICEAFAKLTGTQLISKEP